MTLGRTLNGPKAARIEPKVRAQTHESPPWSPAARDPVRPKSCKILAMRRDTKRQSPKPTAGPLVYPVDHVRGPLDGLKSQARMANAGSNCSPTVAQPPATVGSPRQCPLFACGDSKISSDNLRSMCCGINRFVWAGDRVLAHPETRWQYAQRRTRLGKMHARQTYRTVRRLQECAVRQSLRHGTALGGLGWSSFTSPCMHSWLPLFRAKTKPRRTAPRATPGPDIAGEVDNIQLATGGGPRALSFSFFSSASRAVAPPVRRLVRHAVF